MARGWRAGRAGVGRSRASIEKSPLGQLNSGEAFVRAESMAESVAEPMEAAPAAEGAPPEKPDAAPADAPPPENGEVVAESGNEGGESGAAEAEDGEQQQEQQPMDAPFPDVKYDEDKLFGEGDANDLPEGFTSAFLRCVRQGAAKEARR